MNTITVTAGSAQILLDFAVDMMRNRMAVHQVTPEMHVAVQEVTDGLAALPAEVAVEVTEEAPAEEVVAEAPASE